MKSTANRTRNARRILVKSGILATVGLLAVTAVLPVWAGEKGNPNPTILPVNARAFGTSYAQLTADWWNWSLGAPLATNPLLDTDGSFAGVGQEGKIWFLAGNFGGTTVRTCKIPQGKAIFLPIACTVVWPTAARPTEDLVRAKARANVNGFTVFQCEIDGVPVKKLQSYRVESKAFFLETPAGSLADNFLDPPGVDTAVADGYWLLLAPLSAGKHTIRLRNGTATSSSDVTYHITVTRN